MKHAPSKPHFLSLIVPSYRQERTIVKNIQRIQSVLEQIRYDYEIIVVIDGDIDKSVKKLRDAKIKKTYVIVYKENQGKGFAIRLGMQKAKGDYVMFLDAGNEIDPNGISMLIEHMEWYNADIIVGSKRHSASKVKYSLARRIFSIGYFILVTILFRISVRDTQAGIKIFKRKVLIKILPRLLEKRFAGDLEMLVVAKHFGFHAIYEAPIKLNYELSRITTAANIRSIFGMFLDTLAIFYRTYLLRYYDKKHSHRKVSSQFKYSIFKL